MTPATIIKQAQDDGVKLALSPTGTIKAAGSGDAVTRWLPVIRGHKTELLDELRKTLEEREVMDWLTRIGEDDPVVFRETLDKCRVSTDALSFFLGLARGDDTGAVH